FGGRERYAIPHHDTAWAVLDQRAMGDGERLLETGSEEADVIKPDGLMGARELLAAQPALPLPVHELPLVLADRARRRRRFALGKLGAALFASPDWHLQAPGRDRGRNTITWIQSALPVGSTGQAQSPGR